MTHITRTRIGKLSRRVVSIAAEPTSTATTSAAEAQPTLDALSFVYTAEAIAAAVMCHLERSGRLLPAPSTTVLSPRVDTLPTIQPGQAESPCLHLPCRRPPLLSPRSYLLQCRRLAPLYQLHHLWCLMIVIWMLWSAILL
ncbi:hypothetical protein LSAT2_005616, partial [Lamellibrachia satsuma]